MGFLYLLFLCLFLLPQVNPLSFKVNRFGPLIPDISYQGDAVPSVGVVELNKVNYIGRVGWVTYSDRVRFWDSDSGKLSDFTTRFSFIIDTQGLSSYGHGIAFFLAPAGFQIPPNSQGGFLGLFNTSTTDGSRNQIVAVEFDSFPNPEWDPVVEHVGINNNSIASAVYTPWNASFHTADTADVLISYNATTKNLTVSWSYQKTSNPRESSSIFYVIDLMTALPEWVTVGISAATGLNVERHTLLSWEFNSSLNIKATKGLSPQKIRIIVGVTIPAFFLIAGAVTASLVISRRRRQLRRRKAEAINATSINEDLERGAGPKMFSHQELASATNNFSNERKLGEGGFGAVYKGYFADTDMATAVKKISRSSKQGRKEYVTEVKTISQLRHRNLVLLLGWCHDKGEFLLAYEYMPNGSLDSHLFSRKAPLSWAVRYKISLGLASALLYLHEEWEQCVVHRDVKSSNVMLDSSFNAKLGDFGLARLMDHELGPQTTGIAGTLGYMAPEYISTGRASKESDVYSFGVVALEIATGRKTVSRIEQEGEMSMVERVWNLYGEKKLMSGVDERMPGDFEEKQVERLMIVGLWCAHPDRNFRPSIRQAIQVLNFEMELPCLPLKMPVAVYQVPYPPSVSSGEPVITTSSIQVGR